MTLQADSLGPDSMAAQSGSMAPQRPRKYRDLPGPRGLPLFGNAFQVQAEHAHRQFEAWSLQYGPSFRVQMGPRRLLVSSDPTVINTILRERPEAYERPARQGNLLREMGFEEGLFFANGEAWKHQRRMVMSAFNPAHVKAYFPSLLKVTRRLQSRWSQVQERRGRIDLRADLMRFTVDAIAGLAFGSDVNTLESDGDIIQSHLNRIFPALGRRATGIIPYWRYFRLPADRALDASVLEVRRNIGEFIALARERMQADPGLTSRPGNLLEAMIAAADVDRNVLSDRDIAGNVLTMLLAGEDTTANTLAWLIHFLHRHPRELLRARAEVRQRAPEVDQFTSEQLSELEFLEACIHETMRLKPVAPLLPMRVVNDVTVANIEIPAGTIVVALMRPNAVSADKFTDPQAFMPERWLASAATPAATRASLPFGAGPRLCPGRYLALLEMKMAMAMLLGHFEIDSVTGQNGSEPQELLAFAMGPSAMEMTLKPLST